MPENLVRVCRSVEQCRKAAIMFTFMVPGAWLGAQQTGRRSDAKPASKSVDKVSCARAEKGRGWVMKPL